MRGIYRQETAQRKAEWEGVVNALHGHLCGLAAMRLNEIRDVLESGPRLSHADERAGAVELISALTEWLHCESEAEPRASKAGLQLDLRYALDRALALSTCAAIRQVRLSLSRSCRNSRRGGAGKARRNGRAS